METINATGRRKEAVARVFLSKGNGKIVINNKEYKEYFPLNTLQIMVQEPFKIIEANEKYDLKVNVDGGGIKGQAEAVRLAIARALCKENAEVRPAMRKANLLTRDSRVVERKKPGRKKARKRFQFSKR